MFSAPYPDCCLLTHHDGIIRRGHFEGFLNKDRIDDANSREANDQLVSYIENGKILLALSRLCLTVQTL